MTTRPARALLDRQVRTQLLLPPGLPVKLLDRRLAVPLERARRVRESPRPLSKREGTGE